MKKKIPVKDLKIGMFVCAVETHWLKTPFLFHAFLIESQQHIKKLIQCCRQVTIDTTKGTNVHEENNTLTKQLIEEVKGKTEPVNKSVSPLHKKTLQASESIYSKSVSILSGIFQDIRFGQSLNTASVRRVVEDLTSNIISNENAMLYLTQMKKKNNSLAQKSVNVCILTLAFAKQIGIAKSKMKILGLGAILHDVGMVYVSQDILKNGQQLTQLQRKMVKKHPEFGIDILNKVSGIPEEVKEIVLCHHERCNGQGYPRGLKAKEVSLFTRMVAITSVYEAMTRERLYQQEYSPIETLKSLYTKRNKDFDARLIEKFIHTLGIYPIGCLVETCQKEIAIVIENNSTDRLRPVLELVADKDCNILDSRKVINLCDKPFSKIKIRSVMAAKDPRVAPILEQLGKTINLDTA
ncbi:HD-GYP domain-containing protein [Pseudoalteromonas denitrificans]|uniref:HD-GYP domain, c-di-GMP phosphodiesterase class II (Or its inactivated variant) n=1 Tax=Pseudoalteromonas denitrificans DSM 6059 TaxID=1123010 RepID=A0A1I1ELZ4_9GAMM|nr:HD-GYP domain-containing protein [Pseudoalteromonas denitrificans]SFB87672.1 HD-GYP domain, c-di-GMP phosphodiesterase class II (or its inactivated variant) [Pseudoalteromonas denitrificans DSM 6059]